MHAALRTFAAAALLAAGGAAAQDAAPGETVVTVAGAPIALHGEMWVDTGYLDRDNTQPGVQDEKTNYMNGRFVLGGTYRRQVGGLTASATVELLGLVHEFRATSYEEHAQDVYVKLAGRSWDVQVGRFLGIEAYHRGQGIELYTAEEAGAKNAPTLYHLNLARGRLYGPGQVAAHWRPSEHVTLELGTVYGLGNNTNVLGVRPVVEVAFGGLRLVGGYEQLEYGSAFAGDETEISQRGYGGRVQYTLRGVTAGAGYAWLDQERTQIDGLIDAAETYEKQSVGGFVDAEYRSLSLGLGYHYTTQKNERREEPWHQQAFASLLYRLPIDGLSVKGVFGFARGKIEDVSSRSSFENDLVSFRLRVLYQFR